MDITEVRVKLVERSSERLRAFCSITLDGDFVIRDLKIIDGANGAFVAMPSRKLADGCNRCGCKNHLRAKFCNECGARLNENRAPKDSQGRAKLHADVAHPINAACRERIQNAVIEAFEAELERAKSPDYKPAKYDDFDDDSEEIFEETPVAAAPRPAAQATATKTASAKNAEEDEGAFEDYNSLIAELKREAADRREKHDEKRGWRPEPSEPRPAPREERPRQDRNNGGAGFAEDEPDIEKPQPERISRTSPPPPPPRAPSPPPPPPKPAPRKQEDDDFSAGL